MTLIIYHVTTDTYR